MHDAHLSPSPAHDSSRRRLLLAGIAGTATLATGGALAQSAFPTQPVKIVVPFGPGGFADITARQVAQLMGDKLGHQVLIENRPGAGGVVAAQAVLSAPRDGHTLILFSNGTTIATTLLKLPYDPERDFAPVSTMAYFDLLLLASAKGPFGDLRSLLAEGRKRQLTFGAINPGSTQNLSAELFKRVAKVDATVVPFKTSGDVMTALQRGDVDLGFETYTALRGSIDAGLLKPLACTGSSRTEWLPNVPTVKEAGVEGYDVTGWNAFYVAAGSPEVAVKVYNDTLRQVLATPELRRRFLEMGADPKASTPTEMAAIFERDKRKWAQVIQQANIKVS
ncbi:tripartite tricarboxylate transporter substrate binding protein [Ramlibacter sp. AW1]|uniref:Tripartite tricarboxylate transporter substrate binding protein n=1 Tax=Ramlibacter aurantiacus TaxID=2801330 RepID=A0A936ZQW5_9BURK|nr:tripartite tricarboxylate transporter substrate binding protein [Ramlibacter aurantiacus]MBL0419039.1 tripartite tricarboxylate transporter substrate binding protein [Ramlibacter aurantiacus]